MELYEGFEGIKHPFRNSVITIGNFDGVHKGHQALLASAVEKAAQIGAQSVAVTFDPHPKQILCNGDHPPLITIHEQKAELIAACGVDVLVTVPFTMEFAAIEARQFVVDYLVGKLGMKAIIVGNDYYFGRKREGDIALMKRFAAEMDFDVITPEWVNVGEKRISSTRIREIISRGEVHRAPELLGRFYQVRGTVVSGRDRGGKLLGFPTANINLSDELCPASGVYAVAISCSLGQFQGVANIGYSPTFDDHIFTVEVHILDFSGDIYGETIKVNMVQKLRDEKKFSGIEELSQQIRTDIDNARTIFKDLSEV
ncbi:bifunctional riboflavin kinase/FAD synthetase [Desulfoluna sp.]|uniref:bifunctional riboflavin kinase/FAD synthetase n=1 Tax=Desulfoluna sp. TaxID=2045199 RepID=UPI002614C4CE|nr:bifunctional riboflavin kinase/FAD synthetase [Desulfoluna sp.]